MASIGELFQNLQERANQNPQRLAGFNAVYQFELAGEGGGTYHVRVADGKVEAAAGPATDPGCTVQMTAADFQAMVSGQLNPTAAFMSGKLKIRGDMGLALKLQSLL